MKKDKKGEKYRDGTRVLNGLVLVKSKNEKRKFNKSTVKEKE